MWEVRLQQIISSVCEPISLGSDPQEPVRGRYLQLEDLPRVQHYLGIKSRPLALGREIGRGAEAVVHELIDLEAADLVGVAKFCRYPPDSKEYRTWAVPFRFEGNRRSTKPDIELSPAELVQVPGGLIKVQHYIPDDPATDWATRLPAEPIMRAYRDSGPEAALERARAMVDQHGLRGVLLEMQGRILSEQGRQDEAREVLERAIDAYRAESRAGLLRTGIVLAHVHREIYQENRWSGAAMSVTLNVPGGPSVRQVIYSDPKASALEDTLEDRSLYALFEVLAVEPFFIPALLMLAEEMAASQLTWGRVGEVLDVVDRIDPGRDDARDFRHSHKESVRRYFEHLASIARKPEPGEEVPEPTQAACPEESSEGPTPPESVSEHLKVFDEHYDPESGEGQTAEDRIASARANLLWGRIDQAEQAARDAMRLAPESVEAPIVLAQVLCATEQYDVAGEVLEDAARRFPWHVEIYQTLGDFYLARGRPEEARGAFLQALSSSPAARWPIEMGLGRAYRQLGRRRDALRILRAAWAATNDEPFVAIQLAYALRDAKFDVTRDEMNEAIGVIEHALSRNPGEAGLLVCRAQLLCQTGRLKEAIPVLEEAVALSPDHSIASQLLEGLKKCQ